MNLLDQNSIWEICQYTEWAYTSYKEIQYDPIGYEYIRVHICPYYSVDLNEGIATIDKSNAYLVSTGFMEVLVDSLTSP